MSRGAWMPIRTFSPMIERTDTSMSSPIMMLWFDFLVRTSMNPASLPGGRSIYESRAWGDPQVSNATSHRKTLPAKTHSQPASSRDFRRAGGIPRCASLRPLMSRRSLRPHLNQIRGWVRQGRTDAWIAHQLEVTVQQIQAFKRENDLAPDDVERRHLARGRLRRRDRPARGGRRPHRRRAGGRAGGRAGARGRRRR